jgi:hypothetical protein
MKRDLLGQLKAKAIKAEELRWKNSRREVLQVGLVFRPEELQDVLDLIKKIGFQGEKKDLEFTIPVAGHPTRFFLHAESIFERVSLSRKKSFKSYRASLDAPVPERVNYLKAALKKSRAGQLPGRPPALLEELIKEAGKETLRSKIARKINKLPKEQAAALRHRLSTAQHCLITNYQSAPENLWATLRGETRSRQRRLPNGVSIFFSRERSGRSIGRVGKEIDKAKSEGRVIGEYVLL